TKAQTVGIVGAGPAGLTAAQDLAEAGYEVHLYEKSSRLGGMMAAGIPPFRLPKAYLDQDLHRLRWHCPGIVVHENCALGKEVSLAELKKRHAAVLLAIGLWRDRKLGVPGEDDGVGGLHGIGFLTDLNEGKKVVLHGRAVVIGGGNVAMDVARTARRVGPEAVDVYCLETRETMPAWAHEVVEAEAEGIRIHDAWGPRRILHDGRKVTGVEFVRCVSVFDETGRFNPAYDDKVTTTVACDAVLVAIGLAAENEELQRAGLLERGYVRADRDTLRTADPKVFAAGDGAFGPSAIVYATEQGHRAAHYLQAFLEGREADPYRTRYTTRRVPVAQDPRWEKLRREEPAFAGLGEAPSLLTECDGTYDPETAKRQAARCLRCDAETGSADYNRRTRDHIHLMAKTEPGDAARCAELLRLRLEPRDNPFPPGRPPNFDDVVFLAAGLTRLVIDPYREACATATRLGTLELRQPFLFTGFDDAPADVKRALSAAIRESGCRYVGFRPLEDGAPWLQLVAPGRGEPQESADGLIYVLENGFRAVPTRRAREGQLLGIAVGAAWLESAITHALDNGFDLLVLDGTRKIGHPEAELGKPPDLTVLRDAIRILRERGQEEEIALAYFGGLRSGTDVAKVLGINCNAGVFGVAMGLALGGTIQGGGVAFDGGGSLEELGAAARNWVKGTAEETAIIARCTGKTNVHNLEPEDMRTITIATSEALGIPLASGRRARAYC
ncbi:MAG: FAD-dependent oxidoreductase, partial [Deltaproteobacteria bacterium]|nr:FAD-dependent oxidoreductase [Deltaproteobacteria bacterium]